MKVVLPPPGEPGTHKGISHAIKHYLNPAELWDDLADDIDPYLRPQSLLRDLKIPTPPATHEKYREPCDAMRAAWPKFGLVFLQAYGRIVSQYCDQMPPYEWKKWRALDRLGIRHAAHLGSGILVIVSRSPHHEVLRTAFRPSPATFGALLPAGPENLAWRNIAFEKTARRKLDLWSDARFLAEIGIGSSPSTAEAS